MITASSHKPGRGLLRALITAACLSVLSAGTALAAPAWHDSGPFEHTYDIACGTSITENATAEYVGAYYDLNAPPKVGQIFYGRIVAYGLGNPCVGGFYADLQVHLPPNTQLAISQTNPVVCFYGTNTGGSGQDTTDCPHAQSAGDWPNPNSGWLRFDPTASPYAWPLVTGLNATHAPYWDIRFPMYATAPLIGFSHPCDCLVGADTVAGAGSGANTDGPPAGWDFNGVPSSGPYAPIFVDPNPPTIDYPTPSSSSITSTSAHTTGYLREHYQPGTVYVDLGTTTSYGTSFSYPVDGTADAAQVDQDWFGLAPGTPYHWRLRFVPGGGGPTVSGADQTFTTSPSTGAAPPSPTTGAATGISQTAATLNGTVNPNGSTVTNCHFNYGTSTAYGNSILCSQAVGGGRSPVNVSASLTGLAPGTTYYYRLVASNAGGGTAGSGQMFSTGTTTTTTTTSTTSTSSAATTQASTTTTTTQTSSSHTLAARPPTTATGAATAISPHGATLTGSVDPNGSAISVCHFAYGTTTAYGAFATCAQGFAGTSPVNVSVTLTGLALGTTYHYQLIAANAGGFTVGADQTFTTATIVHPPPCSRLHGNMLKRCIAQQAYLRSLAACDRKYHGAGRSTKQRNAACTKKALASYHHELALISCSQIESEHKRAVCVKHTLATSKTT
jgi:hypothetical protein